jgi:hypothetical protein
MHHGNVSPEIAKGLKALKERIDKAAIPSSKLDETINVAIWNIREFGKKKRTEAAIHYIAEILGQFDLISIVELRDDLSDLGRVLPILGPSWDVVYSDWMDDDGGNKERICFLFDRRAITFNGLAAEVDAPRAKSGSEYLPKQSFWRAPYMCSFRSGNFDFIAIASHARWAAKDTESRRAELQMLADWIDLRFKNKYAEDHDLIIMGDFNIPKIDDKFFKALTGKGLQIPDTLKALKYGNTVLGGSNLKKDARYDQILHLPTMHDRFSNKGGTLDFYISESKIKELFPVSKYTKEKFSYQLSDHFPIWVQINVDIEKQRLDQIIQDGKPGD